MVKQPVKKFKTRKRHNQPELNPTAMILQGLLGILSGVICTFLLLALAALLMKLSAASLFSGAGWVLVIKISASIIGAVTAVFTGGRLLWLRGLASGCLVLAFSDLILSCFVSVSWLPILADLGLGAAAGFASGGLFTILKK